VKPVHGVSKHPLPPMPKLNGIPQRPPSDGIQSSQTAPELRQPPPMTSRSPSPHRVSSPISGRSGSGSHPGSGPPSRNSHDTPPVSSMSLTSSMSNLVHSLEAQIQQGGSWAQPVHDPHGLNNGVEQPRFVGGAPHGPASSSQGPLLHPAAPLPRAGPLPDQIISPGQYPQRAASADPLAMNMSTVSLIRYTSALLSFAGRRSMIRSTRRIILRGVVSTSCTSSLR
jgi:hypothetical protein